MRSLLFLLTDPRPSVGYSNLNLLNIRGWIKEDSGDLPRADTLSRNASRIPSANEEPPYHPRIFVDKMCKTIHTDEASMTSPLSLKYIFGTFLTSTPKRVQVLRASGLERPANTRETTSQPKARRSCFAHDHNKVYETLEPQWPKL